MSAKPGLKTSELADASGVSAATIKHYLRVLDRLAEIGVLTPTRAGYDAGDVKIAEAIVRFRAGGDDDVVEPLRELVGAMHSKLMLQPLERAR